MALSYFYLSIAALLPVVAAILFFLLNKYTKFAKLNFWLKQIIYGVAFGGLAVLGTHWSIPFDGAAANTRDAAVVISGLIFGGPAGIIAGTIGGLERMIVGLVNPAKFGFTVIACSVSTFLAGVVSAILRKFIFDGKRPGNIFGFFVGLVIEVFHLFMVFVTNASNYQKAFTVVQACTPPMLVANSVAVLLGLVIYNVLEKGKGAFKKPDKKGLTMRFTFALSVLTFIAFILSSTFVYFFNDTMVKKQTNNELSYAISETYDEVSNEIIEKISSVKDYLGNHETEMYYGGLSTFADAEGITEINIALSTGEIWHSSERTYDVDTREKAFNLKDYDQSKPFYDLLSSNDDTLVQPFRAMADEDVGEIRKYAAIKFSFQKPGELQDEKGLLQIGYNLKDYSKLVKNTATFKNVGNSGSLVVFNVSNIDELINTKQIDRSNICFDTVVKTNFELSVASKSQNVDIPEDLTPIINGIKNNPEAETFEIEVNNTTYICECKFNDMHFYMSNITQAEAYLSRNISIFVNTFLEIIVFGLFFVTVYNLVKKLVIERIEQTNDSLAEITKGNLDVKVSIGDTTELVSLADGINTTVTALNGYIDAANKRIDEELAFAKAIQTAVLPSTFPAFPDRKEIDIYASMHAAKEVGGDFYDFYFSKENSFHFTVADVSGKGIPAALFMMRAKSILKSLTQTNMPINEVFVQGNNSLCEGNEAGMFVTAWTSTVDLKTGTITFANGGHNPPLIKHKDGRFEYLKAPVNLVLAAMPGMPYGINTEHLEPGDMVFLYTDGVTEGINEAGEQFGEARLERALNSKEFANCQEACEFVYSECKKFAGSAPQFDDITMVCFKYNGK